MATGCDNEESIISAPRYIPMPESLLLLRHRFPTVTRSILVQCVRCHRWVAQPVTTHVPDEVPTCPTLIERVTITTRPHRTEQKNSFSEKKVSAVEWRSPRFCKNYEKLIDVIKPGRAKNNYEPKKKQTYYMPNPANFTCQWTYCILEDVWKDLRGQWISELHAAVDSVTSAKEGESNKGLLKTRSQQPKKDQLNEELAKELYGRRSERIAKKPQSAFDIKDENSESPGTSTDVLHTGRITQHVNTLIHNDEAVVASFCWISCDYCGKLRWVHQPFPGGAPFVCALALNIGSCSVPEQEGLSPAFFNESGHNDVVDDNFEGIVGDVALREAVVKTSSSLLSARDNRCGSRGRTSSQNGNGVNNRAVNTNPAGWFSDSRGEVVKAFCRRRGNCKAVSPYLPSLRELTIALRKRALGAFVKNIMVIPDEVRLKREEVVRASVISSIGDSEGAINTDSVAFFGEKNNGVQANASRKVHKGSVESGGLPMENQYKPSKEKKQEDNRGKDATNLEAIDKALANDGGVTCIGKYYEEKTFPRRTTRLGCPPRCNAPFEIKKEITDNAQTVVIKAEPQVETQVDVYAANYEPPQVLLTSVEPGTAATPPEEVNSDDRSRRGLQKAYWKNMVTSEMVTAAAAFNDSATGVGSRMRTRRFLNEEKNINSEERDNTTINSSDAHVNSLSRGCRRATYSKQNETETVKTKKHVRQNISTILKAMESDVIHWVCCDVCSRWRIVPKKIEAKTKFWACEMRGDGTTCSDTDDEIRMNRLSKRRRTSKNSGNYAAE